MAGRQPELWDPVTGEIRNAAAFLPTAHGRTWVPIELAPCGSLFVVFRTPIPPDRKGVAQGNWPVLRPVQEIGGPWSVRFDPRWGGPAEVRFPRLVDWTTWPADGVKYYSGTAAYVKEFDLAPAAATRGSSVLLDLGVVNSVARVRLNGQDLGILWTAPWRRGHHPRRAADGQSAGNRGGEPWANRIIGDATLPPEKRCTKTNVSYERGQPLLASGLLGPVTLQTSR